MVDRVLDTSEAASIKAIRDKYRNPHIIEYLNGERRGEDDAILFGDPILSRVLPRLLPFDPRLAEKLSLNIPFRDDKTENQCISSATRQWRKLTDEDVEIILDEIKRFEDEGLVSDVILSTDEVLEIRESDLEKFIVKNPDVFGSNLTLMGRQVDTRAGRIDLLFQDEYESYVIVELKLNEIGRSAINQLKRHMQQVRRTRKKRLGE